MITIWTINQLERNTSNGFVTTVHYNVNAVDGLFTASTYGTISFQGDTPATPFESLTEEQVTAWVKDKLGEEAVETSLQSQIEAQRNPVKATGLPW